MTHFRVYRCWETGQSFRYFVRGFPKQKMGLHMERKRFGAHHVQVFGLVCGAQKIVDSKGRLIPIQEYVSICK